MNTASNCTNSLREFNFNYNIYDYAVSLTKKYGSNIASFQFENVVFLNLPETVNQVKHFLSLNITDKKLIFDGESGQKLFIDIDSSHINKIIEMSDVHDLLECYNRTIINCNKIDLIWNAPYALLMNNRLGKSIFNTNLTFTYTQHIADYLEPGAKNLLLQYKGHGS